MRFQAFILAIALFGLSACAQSFGGAGGSFGNMFNNMFGEGGKGGKGKSMASMQDVHAL